MEEISFEQDIRNCLETLRSGGIILYPTDTIWGLGCDATNAEAVEKIYRLKHRDPGKSMLVLVDSDAMLERTVEEVPEVAWQLMEAAVDPVTIIYDRGTGVVPSLLAADGSLGVRVTHEDFSRTLCRRLRHPLVSTSANFSGEKAPSDFRDIDPKMVDAVDYVAHYGRDEINAGKASNIIKIGNGGEVRVIR